MPSITLLQIECSEPMLAAALTAIRHNGSFVAPPATEAIEPTPPDRTRALPAPTKLKKNRHAFASNEFAGSITRLLAKGPLSQKQIRDGLSLRTADASRLNTALQRLKRKGTLRGPAERGGPWALR